MRQPRFTNARSTITALALAIMATALSVASVLADSVGGPLPR
jgi:hypothetical protein